MCAYGLRLAAILISGAMLAACGASSLNPFKKEEVRLPGERIAVIKPESDIKVDQQLARVPVTLPAPKRNTEWSQPGGTPANAPGHLQIAGGLTVAWRASVGAGSGDEGRLTAVPIIYQNRIYALDAEGAVSA
ncbi:MAG: pyrrolo-quinoline quinone, partial [Alphaproteobacteria bacterium]